jgi:hypothetical protein
MLDIHKSHHEQTPLDREFLFRMGRTMYHSLRYIEHERNSLICSPDRPVTSLADAIERLAKDDALAMRLAAGARALYLERHLPERTAAETLALIEQIKAAIGTR